MAISRDFLIEVQKGNVPKHSMVHKFGHNNSVPNGSWEFVNTLGFTAWPLTTGETVRVKAGNAEDTSAGAGAREISVNGIDGTTFLEATEAIATSGTSASAVTTTEFARVHRAWVSDVGTYGSGNSADVIIENSAGDKDLIKIENGEGQTEYAAWTVPSGSTAYLTSVHAHVDSQKTADIKIFTRSNIDNINSNIASKRLRLNFDGVEGYVAYAPKGPEFSMPGKTDIWAEAYGDGAESQVAVDFELLVVED